MAYTKYIGYGGTATLLLLITWFVSSAHFSVEYEGDSTCAGTYSEPCEWKYNITLTTVQTYYIQNKNSIDIVFLPDVKQVVHCKRDGRMTASWRADRELAPCGIGWREFDWKTPLTSQYKYINKFYKNKKQEFKIVVFKYNPEDIIKFGGEITKDEFDPFFYGISLKNTFIEEIEIAPNVFDIRRCENKSRINYITCFNNWTHFYNYTFINNKTGINESKTDLINFSSPYNCKPYTVYYKANCKTIGIRNLINKLDCPDNHCCGIKGNMFWILDENDGDCNFDATEHPTKGWSRVIIPINDLKKGMTIRVSDFKKTIAKVEKLSVSI